MTAQHTIFVVEDDERMRVAIELLLRTEGYEVQSYPSAEAFLAGETCLQSICLLTDVLLPGMDGLALHRRLVSIGATPVTVMITGHGDVPMAVSALKEGVVDFIEKPVRDHETKMANFKNKLGALTSREAEVLDLLVEGQSSKFIASRLGISVRTAEHYRANIMEKLGAPSTSRLIAWMSAL